MHVSTHFLNVFSNLPTVQSPWASTVFVSLFRWQPGSRPPGPLQPCVSAPAAAHIPGAKSKRGCEQEYGFRPTEWATVERVAYLLQTTMCCGTEYLDCCSHTRLKTDSKHQHQPTSLAPSHHHHLFPTSSPSATGVPNRSCLSLGRGLRCPEQDPIDSHQQPPHRDDLRASSSS